MLDMEVDCNRECITFATEYRTINGGEGLHCNGVKDANLAAHGQAMSSMVTLASDGLANSTLPLGTTYVSMGPPNGANIPEQVYFTLQPMNGNVVDSNEDAKNELSHTINAAAIANANAAKINGTAQILSGGLQTMVNLQGISSMPQMQQMPQLAIPAQQYGALTHPSNATTAQTAQVALQQMPQPVGMPQLILAGGQFLQGIQGAQLFIPTSSGVATQQILTIPVNQIPSGQQLLQVMTPNGQVVTTSMNNLQAMTSQQTATCNTNGIQPHTMITNNVQSFNQNQMLPQIITNAAGQILAVSPQLIGQSSGVVQVYGSPSHLQNDKQQSVQTNGQMTVSSSKSPVSAQTNGLISAQTHVQITTMNEATPQVTSQNLQVQRTTATPNQVVQVAQTSSPSVTSTESTSEFAPISQTNANTVDGINLEEIKEFAKAFKIRRLSLGLTQTQVGQALSVTEGPAYSQSAICRFEKLDITPKSAQKIKPVLERWMIEAEKRYKNGADNLTDFIGTEPSKKRKRRTSFTPQALNFLNQYFERNTHPSGAEMTEIAEKLNYEREVVRVWFCNKRQTLKNSVKKLKVANQ